MRVALTVLNDPTTAEHQQVIDRLPNPFSTASLLDLTVPIPQRWGGGRLRVTARQAPTGRVGVVAARITSPGGSVA